MNFPPRDDRPVLSVVIPVYGCTGALTELHRRLSAAITGIGDPYEIVFVDDRGPQDAWPVLTDLARLDPHVRPFRMSRNYGQQIAITAGLAKCRGDYAVVMDCDLQDPPELIPTLWKVARGGIPIVYAKRVGGDHYFRKLGNRLYFALMYYVAGYNVDPAQGSFSLISRPVIDAYLRFNERERHYLFILRWLGFRSSNVEFERSERASGQSSYSLVQLLKHASQGFFFLSTVFLSWILWLGLFVSAASVVLAGVFIWRALDGNPPEGWTALAVIQLLSSGMILLALGAVGLYVGRTFENSKNRPLYVFESDGPVLDQGQERRP